MAITSMGEWDSTPRMARLYKASNTSIALRAISLLGSSDPNASDKIKIYGLT
jgi:hypothetical protein